MIKETLRDLSMEKAPGPHPSFTVFDLLRAIELIAKKEPIGRGKIADKLEIGEGAVRTLIGRLKDSKMIVTSKPGCSLTEKGSELWNEIQLIVPQKVRLMENDFTFAPYNVAVLVRGRSTKITHGLEQRDAAVAAGARGATTLVFKGNKLGVPMVSEDLSKDFPLAFNQITGLMRLEENDVVVIGSADDLKKAEYGALAAAWTII